MYGFGDIVQPYQDSVDIVEARLRPPLPPAARASVVCSSRVALAARALFRRWRQRRLWRWSFSRIPPNSPLCSLHRETSTNRTRCASSWRTWCAPPPIGLCGCPAAPPQPLPARFACAISRHCTVACLLLPRQSRLRPPQLSAASLKRILLFKFLPLRTQARAAAERASLRQDKPKVDDILEVVRKARIRVMRTRTLGNRTALAVPATSAARDGRMCVDVSGWSLKSGSLIWLSLFSRRTARTTRGRTSC